MGHPVAFPHSVGMTKTLGTKLVLQLEPHLPAEPMVGQTEAAKHKDCPTETKQQEPCILPAGADRIFSCEATCLGFFLCLCVFCAEKLNMMGKRFVGCRLFVQFEFETVALLFQRGINVVRLPLKPKNGTLG